MRDPANQPDLEGFDMDVPVAWGTFKCMCAAIRQAATIFGLRFR